MAIKKNKRMKMTAAMKMKMVKKKRPKRNKKLKVLSRQDHLKPNNLLNKRKRQNRKRRKSLGLAVNFTIISIYLVKTYLLLMKLRLMMIFKWMINLMSLPLCKHQFLSM
jgi:hypothetical protein